MWIKLKQYIDSRVLRNISWVELASIGESKLVKSLMIWLIVVPLLAKILGPIPDEITLRLFGAELQISFGLPFNILLFYLSALGFTIGGLVYRWKCPTIIQNIKCITKNISHGNGVSAYMYELSIMDRDIKYRLSRVVSERLKEVSEFDLSFMKDDDYPDCKQDDGLLKRIYVVNAYIDEVKLAEKKFRFLTIVFYASSLIFLALIFFQNTCAVIKEVI